MQTTNASGPKPLLYTAEERARRDASPWTMVQGILAPAQFLAFAVSLVLVLRFLLTGEEVLTDGRPPAGWGLPRPPLFLETSLPGVFAAGDVRHRSVKRIASAAASNAKAKPNGLRRCSPRPSTSAAIAVNSTNTSASTNQ